MYQQENGWRDPPWEELIDGREIPILPHPGTNHFVIAGNVRLVFGEYLHDSPATVFGGSFALCLTERDIFSPDCAVVCDPDKIRPDGVHGAPDLVVEILSPATYLRDRTYKKDVYERCGVREYWIVTAEERTIEQYVLTDGCFVLRKVFCQYPHHLREKLSDEEKALLPMVFRCTIFDNLIIRVDDIFRGVYLFDANGKNIQP